METSEGHSFRTTVVVRPRFQAVVQNGVQDVPEPPPREHVPLGDGRSLEELLNMEEYTPEVLPGDADGRRLFELFDEDDDEVLEED